MIETDAAFLRSYAAALRIVATATAVRGGVDADDYIRDASNLEAVAVRIDNLQAAVVFNQQIALDAGKAVQQVVPPLDVLTWLREKAVADTALPAGLLPWLRLFHS